MTSLTERYLFAALRGIPAEQRGDVERELRSSITDAVDDRVAAGEESADAETAVLEGLGNPSLLAASYAGRLPYLIGPEFFPAWRHILVMLVPIVLPIVSVIVAAIELSEGAAYIDAVLAGVGAALSTGVQVAFWVTLTFALLERADGTRDARAEIAGAPGRWTVGMLPEEPAARVGVGETVGEIIVTILTVGGLLFLRDTSWFSDADGRGVAVLAPELSSFWLPALIALLVALAALRVVVYLVGRWTLGLAAANAALQLALSVPVIWLALQGLLVNREFALALGWPEVASGTGIVMLTFAAGVLLVTGWEIADGFRRARNGRHAAVGAGA